MILMTISFLSASRGRHGTSIIALLQRETNRRPRRSGNKQEKEDLEKNNRNPHHFLFFLTLFLRPPPAFFYDNDRVKSCCRCALKARCYSVVVLESFLSFRRREWSYHLLMFRVTVLEHAVFCQFSFLVRQNYGSKKSAASLLKKASLLHTHTHTHIFE